MAEEITIYEIDPTKKYIATFPTHLTYEVRERIQNVFQAWVESDKKLLIMPPGFKLVKVELPEEKTEK